jgi:hypothetical protein
MTSNYTDDRRREPGADPPSLGDLVASVSDDLSVLMRQELALAKAEASQTARRAGKGAGMYGAAGIAANFTLLFLSIAAWWALGNAIGRGWAALVVAVVWGIITAVLVVMGRKQFKAAGGLPQTTDTVKRVPEALKPNPEAAR